jgi:hypothetical protein
MRRGRAASLLAGVLLASCGVGSAALPALEPIPSIAEPAPPAFDVGPPDSAPPNTLATTTTTLPSTDDPLKALAGAGNLAPEGFCSEYAPLPMVTCATLAGNAFGGQVYAVTRVGLSPVFVRLSTSGNGLVADGSYAPLSGQPMPSWASAFADYPTSRHYSPYDLVFREVRNRSLSHLIECPNGPIHGQWCTQYEVVDPTHVRVQLQAPPGYVSETWDVEYDPDSERYGWLGGSPVPTPGRNP